MRTDPRRFVYRTYERRLEHEIQKGPVPHHVGVILDGNRRWAASMGYRSAADGHRHGAEKIDELLGWCKELEIDVVTLWLLSTENLERDPDELSALLKIIVNKIEQVAARGDWKIRAVGALELLPIQERDRIEAAQQTDREESQRTLNLAVGYGGRREIADATRRMLESYAEQGLSLSEASKRVSVDQLAEHLYTAGQADPDLIIRTSGESRLSGFLLWQSAHSEFYFCDPYWPDFRRIDFLRAVRSFQQRKRKFGR